MMINSITIAIILFSPGVFLGMQSKLILPCGEYFICIYSKVF